MYRSDILVLFWITTHGEYKFLKVQQYYAYNTRVPLFTMEHASAKSLSIIVAIEWVFKCPSKITLVRYTPDLSRSTVILE